MKNKKYDVFLITGGTGGHIFPAINFSEYLSSKGISNLLITDIRGKNYFNKKNNNFKIIFSSHLNKKNFNFLKGILILMIGLIQFKILFFRYRPKKIITFGSYTSLTPLICAMFYKKIFKTNVYFHEQNSVIGSVHKVFLFTADKVFTTFKDTRGLYSNHKVIHTGFPSSKKIKEFKKNSLSFTKKLNKLNLVVFGGSQGASNLSIKIVDLLTNLSLKYQSLIDLTIQVPQKDLNLLNLKLSESKITFEISTFYYDILQRLSKSDLCICRSGSSTINEIISLKIPSILIPLPTSKKNHQYYNAKYLSDLNAAILIEEKNLSKDNVLNIIKDISLNKKLLKSLFQNLNKIKELDTNKLMYKEIFNKKNE